MNLEEIKKRAEGMLVTPIPSDTGWAAETIIDLVNDINQINEVYEKRRKQEFAIASNYRKAINKAKEVIKYYADKNNWSSAMIAVDDVSGRPYQYGGKKARVYLSEEQKEESVELDA